MGIRKYKGDDFPIVVGIYNQSKLDELINESVTFELLPLEDDTKRLNELMESDIFIYQADHDVGFGAYYKSEIRALFVHPNSRGKGIGKELLEFMLNQITDTVTLHVAKSNTSVKALYEKYGFCITNEFETSYNAIPVLANTMSLEKFNGSKLAYIFKGKLLVYKRDDKRDIPWPNKWDFAGGGREGNESPEQCVLRELEEEFSISIPESRLIYKIREKSPSGNGYSYFFVAEGKQVEVDNISFGNEGQYWELMKVEDYLNHPDGIESLKSRLRRYLKGENKCTT